MKRFLLIIGILLSCQAFAANPGKTVSKARITSILSECRHYEGAEMVRLGRVATSAIKGVIRLSALDDPDAREALSLMKGIHGIMVLSYEECSADDKARITRKLEQAVEGSEMLMEASGDGERMTIYGVVDDNSDKVRDFVLYSPSDCAIICIFGSISMETVARISSND